MRVRVIGETAVQRQEIREGETIDARFPSAADLDRVEEEEVTRVLTDPQYSWVRLGELREGALGKMGIAAEDAGIEGGNHRMNQMGYADAYQGGQGSVCPHCGRCQHCGGGGPTPFSPYAIYNGTITSCLTNANFPIVTLTGFTSSTR